MITRHFSRWFWPALAIACLTIPFFANKAAANKAASQPQGGTANVKTGGGLTVVTFIVKPGTIKVNLPDDMRAGDTISGTVIAEPNGATKEERGANQTELKKFGIRLFERSEDKPEEVNLGDVSTVFKYALIGDPKSGNVFSVGLVVGIPSNIVSKVSVPVLPLTPSGAVITPDPKITPPTQPSGAVITPDPKITPPTNPRGPVITPDPKSTTTFTIPPLGQAGNPIVIGGPFDGDFSNTKLITGEPGESPDVWMGLVQFAESPREAVFESPSRSIAGSASGSRRDSSRPRIGRRLTGGQDWLCAERIHARLS